MDNAQVLDGADEFWGGVRVNLSDNSLIAEAPLERVVHLIGAFVLQRVALEPARGHVTYDQGCQALLLLSQNEVVDGDLIAEGGRRVRAGQTVMDTS
jgi:hypothetical protein